MKDRAVYLCDGIRTPIGRYGGALAQVRPDDLAAHVIATLMARQPQVDWEAVDDVYFGCANGAGEDNRNVARMSLLLAGFPEHVGGAHTSAELLEEKLGREVDAPLCMTCGTKMRPSGSCYVCEGCGSTSGCS